MFGPARLVWPTLLLLAACCPAVSRPLDDLAARASRDLSCPQISLTIAPGRTLPERVVSGCGKQRVYVMLCNGECTYR
jgi:hypothetical protein